MPLTSAHLLKRWSHDFPFCQCFVESPGSDVARCGAFVLRLSPCTGEELVHTKLLRIQWLGDVTPTGCRKLSHIVTMYRDQDSKNLSILYPIGSMYGMVSYMFSITNHYGWDFHIFHYDDCGSVAFHYENILGPSAQPSRSSSGAGRGQTAAKLQDSDDPSMFGRGKPWKTMENMYK